MTSVALATELEVAPRTIFRDVDALTEAGLPIIVYHGNRGGIELGFNYRTRLTGLAADEAEAMALILTRPMPELTELGLADAAERARGKMLESFPDRVRETIALARRRFGYAAITTRPVDPRVPALATAIRNRTIVRIAAKSKAPRTIHPVGLVLTQSGWLIEDALVPGRPIKLEETGDINILAHNFGEVAE